MSRKRKGSSEEDDSLVFTKLTQTETSMRAADLPREVQEKLHGKNAKETIIRILDTTELPKQLVEGKTKEQLVDEFINHYQEEHSLQENDLGELQKIYESNPHFLFSSFND